MYRVWVTRDPYDFSYAQYRFAPPSRNSYKINSLIFVGLNLGMEMDRSFQHGTRQAQEDASALHCPKTLVQSNYERWHFSGLLRIKSWQYRNSDVLHNMGPQRAICIHGAPTCHLHSWGPDVPNMGPGNSPPSDGMLLPFQHQILAAKIWKGIEKRKGKGRRRKEEERKS